MASATASELENMLGKRRPCKGTAACNASGAQSCTSSAVSSRIVQPPEQQISTPSSHSQSEPEAMRPGSPPSDISYKTTFYTPPYPYTTGESTTHDMDNYCTPYYYSSAGCPPSFSEPSARSMCSSAIPSNSDTRSCYAAAEIVRSFCPLVRHELEKEMGYTNGMDCSVLNSCTFQIMDHYDDGT